MTASNEHWGALTKDYGASEDLTAALGQVALDRIKIVNRIRDEVSHSTLARVYKDFAAFCNFYNEKIAQLDTRSGCEAMQSTDRGHCFAETDYTLLYIAQEHDFYSMINRQKNSLFAVVLEDNPAQLEIWSNAIENLSPFSLQSPAACCRSPEELKQHIGNAAIGYYLLDVENGQNRVAGIEAAESVIAHLLNSDPSQRLPCTEIVVWSSSRELANLAKERLKRFIEANQYADQIYFETGQCLRPIHLRVCLNAELPFVPCFQTLSKGS